ncbi:hypothetical protein HDU92_005192 [Lobulomyces angularis]|nr:hypothetical protein HDU92_005192 [Lobulomyces angularis]
MIQNQNLNKQKIVDDDEFEDFTEEDWEENKNDQLDITLWDDSWDNIENLTNDEFTRHLREELNKKKENK